MTTVFFKDSSVKMFKIHFKTIFNKLSTITNNPGRIGSPNKKYGWFQINKDNY